MHILYISYFYPPLGGPASLRNVKVVKYLAKEGISCDVITVSDIEYIQRDYSLLSECSEQRLIRTDSLDPMALFRKTGISKGNQATGLYMNTPENIKLWIRRLYLLDEKIGWNRFLIKAGRKALSETHYDLIYISLGPFSSGVGAYKLSKESGIPLVLDMRDYWNLLSDYNLQATTLHRKYAWNWEKRFYSYASLIVTATQGIERDIIKAFGPEFAEKTLTVYNGWDENDFIDLPAVPKPSEYTFSYFGSIYARRNMNAFYKALHRLLEEGKIPQNIKVRLFGNYFKETREEITQSGITNLIEIIPPLEHREALANMMASDVLLLVINSSSPYGTLTSKVGEYLRTQKPILAMVPYYGEAAELLRECGHNYICAMESADTIYHSLKRLFSETEHNYQIPWEMEKSKQVHNLANRLKEMLG